MHSVTPLHPHLLLHGMSQHCSLYSRGDRVVTTDKGAPGELGKYTQWDYQVP